MKWNWAYYPYLDAPNKQEESALKAGYVKVVIKDEADKVIAEKDEEIYNIKYSRDEWAKACNQKDKEIAELEKRIDDGDKDFEMANNQNERLLKIVRHHKYKRCLAMAMFCEERYYYLICLENWQMTDKEYQQVIGDYWIKWSKRWLELAEQFKEAK